MTVLESGSWPFHELFCVQTELLKPPALAPISVVGSSHLNRNTGWECTRAFTAHVHSVL